METARCLVLAGREEDAIEAANEPSARCVLTSSTLRIISASSGWRADSPQPPRGEEDVVATIPNDGGVGSFASECFAAAAPKGEKGGVDWRRREKRHATTPRTRQTHRHPPDKPLATHPTNPSPPTQQTPRHPPTSRSVRIKHVEAPGRVEGGFDLQTRKRSSLPHSRNGNAELARGGEGRQPEESAMEREGSRHRRCCFVLEKGGSLDVSESAAMRRNSAVWTEGKEASVGGGRREGPSGGRGANPPDRRSPSAAMRQHQPARRLSSHGGWVGRTPKGQQRQVG